jgi:hypothetical protein
MENPDRPAVVVARVVIAHLQQSVQALMDGDRVLPADGLSLLATLDRALEGLTDEDGPAVPSLGPPGTSPALRAPGSHAATGSRRGTHAVGRARSEPWAGIEAFIGRVQALIEAGVLEAGDGHPRIEAAAAMAALLRSTDGTDSEPRGGRRHTSWG